MSTRDGYYLDLLVAALLRGGLFAGLLAIMAMISACSYPSAKDILPSMSSDPLSFREGSSDQTRNQLPQRGCDEKSDSSLKKPLL